MNALLLLLALSAAPGADCLRDEAGLFSQTQRQNLVGMCERQAQQGGPEVVLATLESAPEGDLPGLARDRLAKWKVGERSGGRGVLVLGVKQGALIHVEPTAVLAATLDGPRCAELVEKVRDERKKGLDSALFWLTVHTLTASTEPPRAAQPDPRPEPAAAADPVPAPEPSRKNPLLPLGIALALAGLLGTGLVAVSLFFADTRTGKLRALDKALGVPASVVVLGGVATAYLGKVHRDVPGAVTLLVLVGGAGVAAQLVVRALMQGRARSFRVACPGCGKPMSLMGEKEDDARLDATQRAEERVFGRDWEVWVCRACGREEQRGANLDGAIECPRCQARTLRVERRGVPSKRDAERRVGGPLDDERPEERIDGRLASDEREVVETCANPSCGYVRRRVLKVSAPPG